MFVAPSPCDSLASPRRPSSEPACSNPHKIATPFFQTIRARHPFPSHTRNNTHPFHLGPPPMMATPSANCLASPCSAMRRSEAEQPARSGRLRSSPRRLVLCTLVFVDRHLLVRSRASSHNTNRNRALRLSPIATRVPLSTMGEIDRPGSPVATPATTDGSFPRNMCAERKD